MYQGNLVLKKVVTEKGSFNQNVQSIRQMLILVTSL